MCKLVIYDILYFFTFFLFAYQNPIVKCVIIPISLDLIKSRFGFVPYQKFSSQHVGRGEASTQILMPKCAIFGQKQQTFGPFLGRDNFITEVYFLIAQNLSNFFKTGPKLCQQRSILRSVQTAFYQVYIV